MKRLVSLSLWMSIAVLAILGSTQGAFGVETTLTDYSRAVILENPVYYWTFNEADTTDVAQDVMRYETATQMIPVANVTRTDSYSTALGSAASFTLNSAFGSSMIDRARTSGAYAFEFWVKADADTTKGYIADFLGGGGDEPGIIHDYTDRYLELWYGGARTGATTELDLSDTDWHHVVLAVNCDAVAGTMDQIDVAIDGVVTTNVAAIDAKQLNISGNMTIGAWATYNDADEYTVGVGATKAASSFQGQIDEFAIYDLGGMDPTQVADKVASLASHYALATNPTAITPFAAVDGSEITYSVIDGNEPSPSYADDTGHMLTDGVFAGSGATSYSGESVGYYGDHYVTDYTTLEFDLSEAKTLDAIWVDYLGPGGKYGINAPTSVELSFSTDGVNFSEPILYEEFNNTTDPNTSYFNERCAQIDLDSVDAQYVRATFGFLTNFVFLSEVRFMEELEVVNPAVAGDANNDGKVDGSDVTILAGNWQKGVSDGLTASWEEGDFNGDGKVDGSDVTILAGNWQYGVEAAASVVPEPGTIVLLISAFASLLIWRRVR